MIIHLQNLVNQLSCVFIYIKKMVKLKYFDYKCSVQIDVLVGQLTNGSNISLKRDRLVDSKGYNSLEK